MPTALNRTNVVVLIMLFALMLAIGLPYLQQSREAERRTACEFRMGQVARSILEYEDSHTEFPGYRNVVTIGANKASVASWAGLVLPYLSGAPSIAMDKRGDLSQDKELTTHDRTAAGSIPELICPDDASAAEFSRTAILSYVANCGVPDAMAAETAPPDWRANGVFMDGTYDREENQRVSLSYVEEHDGAAETLLISENVDAGLWTDSAEPRVGFVWTTNGGVGQRVPMDRVLAINEQIGDGDSSIMFAQPSSFHSGGVNAAFCDERVEFLSEDIDYLVFTRLMAPDNSAIKYPGTKTPIGPPFRANAAKNSIMRRAVTVYGDDLR